jgi:hypothetical protein
MLGKRNGGSINSKNHPSPKNERLSFARDVKNSANTIRRTEMQPYKSDSSCNIGYTDKLKGNTIFPRYNNNPGSISTIAHSICAVNG